MKVTIKKISLSEKDNKYYLVTEIIPNEIDSIKKIIDSDKPKELDVKIKRNKRSLDANSYLWVLINKIAIKMGSTDNEIYKIMLRDYGTKEYVVATNDARSILMKAYKIVEVISDVIVNGKKAKQFRLIRGSSTYDSKEMSIMINGVVEEAKAQGIQVLSKKEIDRMIEMYGLK